MIKYSTFSGVREGEPLVRVITPDTDFTKEASVHPEVLAFKEQLDPEPGKTYVHILALGAGEYYGANLNNDHFPWAGLTHDHTKTPHQYTHGYKTFLNAHAFGHHVNKDPNKAYGDVLVSVLNEKMKRVELISVLDHEKCHKFGGGRALDRILEGEFPSTSMGCKIPYDVCSICGHKAKTRKEYCEHMLRNPGKILEDGRKVFVYNPYPRFFDISLVFIGADRTSHVLEKLATGSAIVVPRLPESMEKAASVRKALNMPKQKDPSSSLKIRVKKKPMKRKRGDVSIMHLVTDAKKRKKKGVKSLDELLRSLPKKNVTRHEGGETTMEKAAAEKLGEIIKRVRAMGKAIPLMKSRDATMPRGLLDQMASSADLPGALSSVAKQGVILKPSEFQYVMLRNAGRPTLADRMFMQRKVFRPVDKSISITITISPKTECDLGEWAERRSFLMPIAASRITKYASVVSEPLEEVGGDEMDKISALYNGYRLGVLRNMESYIKEAGVFSTQREAVVAAKDAANDALNKGGGDKAVLLATLGAVPLAYALSAHWQDRIERGEDLSILKEIVAKNPNLSAALIAAGTAILGQKIKNVV